MKVLLMLLSISFSFARGARYGLLRVASPVAGTTKEALIPNRRSLFDEDFHL